MQNGFNQHRPFTRPASFDTATVLNRLYTIFADLFRQSNWSGNAPEIRPCDHHGVHFLHIGYQVDKGNRVETYVIPTDSNHPAKDGELSEPLVRYYQDVIRMQLEKDRDAAKDGGYELFTSIQVIPPHFNLDDVRSVADIAYHCVEKPVLEMDFHRILTEKPPEPKKDEGADSKQQAARSSVHEPMAGRLQAEVKFNRSTAAPQMLDLFGHPVRDDIAITVLAVTPERIRGETKPSDVQIAKMTGYVDLQFLATGKYRPAFVITSIKNLVGQPSAMAEAAIWMALDSAIAEGVVTKSLLTQLNGRQRFLAVLHDPSIPMSMKQKLLDIKDIRDPAVSNRALHDFLFENEIASGVDIFIDMNIDEMADDRFVYQSMNRHRGFFQNNNNTSKIYCLNELIQETAIVNCAGYAVDPSGEHWDIRGVDYIGTLGRGDNKFISVLDEAANRFGVSNHDRSGRYHAWYDMSKLRAEAERLAEAVKYTSSQLFITGYMRRMLVHPEALRLVQQMWREQHGHPDLGVKFIDAPPIRSVGISYGKPYEVIPR